jgi:hypothetical protein
MELFIAATGLAIIPKINGGLAPRRRSGCAIGMGTDPISAKLDSGTTIAIIITTAATGGITTVT